MTSRCEVEEWLLLNGVCGHTINEAIDSGVELPISYGTYTAESGLTFMDNASSRTQITSDSFLEVGV